MNREVLTFYPEHPSNAKTWHIETSNWFGVVMKYSELVEVGY